MTTKDLDNLVKEFANGKDISNTDIIVRRNVATRKVRTVKGDGRA